MSHMWHFSVFLWAIENPAASHSLTSRGPTRLDTTNNVSRLSIMLTWSCSSKRITDHAGCYPMALKQSWGLVFQIKTLEFTLDTELGYTWDQKEIHGVYMFNSIVKWIWSMPEFIYFLPHKTVVDSWTVLAEIWIVYGYSWRLILVELPHHYVLTIIHCVAWFFRLGFS